MNRIANYLNHDDFMMTSSIPWYVWFLLHDNRWDMCNMWCRVILAFLFSVEGCIAEFQFIEGNYATMNFDISSLEHKYFTYIQYISYFRNLCYLRAEYKFLNHLISPGLIQNHVLWYLEIILNILPRNIQWFSIHKF